MVRPACKHQHSNVESEPEKTETGYDHSEKGRNRSPVESPNSTSSSLEELKLSWPALCSVPVEGGEKQRLVSKQEGLTLSPPPPPALSWLLGQHLFGSLLTSYIPEPFPGLTCVVTETRGHLLHKGSLASVSPVSIPTAFSVVWASH